MGKFTLLTTLTLSAAGYNKGIDSAKKQTKALTDGVKTAGNTMKEAFSGIGDLAGTAGSQLSGVANIAKGGVSAFKSMIPAITGVKTAIVSTGVGAIVIAIGTAFAALSSYLKGTSEGAGKLNKVLAIAKGVFNAILVRVQLLGEAVSLVFSGKFKEAGQKLKEAFSGGLLDEIKEDVNSMVDFAERENKLWQDKLNWGYKEADLLKELNRQKLIAEDKENGIFERQKAINAAIAIQKQISTENNRLATEEYEIVKGKNALGNNSREDHEKELELYKKKEGVIADEYSKLKEMTAKKGEINNQIKTELDRQKQINQLDKIHIANVDLLAMNKIKPIDTTSLVETKTKLLDIRDALVEVSVVMQNGLYYAIGSISEVLGAGADNFRDYVRNVKAAVKQVIGAFIAEGVAAMVGNALKSAAKTPYGFIIAPALAALAGGLAKTAFNSLIPKFAAGGIVGGNSFSGDQVPALVNSGEMILNRSQQANLFHQISGPGQSGNVTFRIEGTTLIGVLNNMNRRSSSFR